LTADNSKRREETVLKRALITMLLLVLLLLVVMISNQHKTYDVIGVHTIDDSTSSIEEEEIG
jgi:cell division protein FtsL